MSALEKLDERRFSGRVVIPYAARISGVNVEGELFKEQTRVENISAGGVYMRLSRSLEKETRVSIAVRLSLSADDNPALRLVARGFVMRSEPLDDGTHGVAVEFSRRRVF
jgi:c-di-GMP-binding flagellar brake protein YcgR